MDTIEKLKQYATHSSTCNKMQDWTEAETALADTPTKFRDDSYYKAIQDLENRKRTCTCGIEEILKNINMEQLKEDKKGGFFDLPKNNTCNDPGHNPPTHLHIPQGKGYRHVCPKCGATVDLIPPQISF